MTTFKHVLMGLGRDLAPVVTGMTEPREVKTVIDAKVEAVLAVVHGQITAAFESVRGGDD